MSISAVERETGLNKETLRVWERRYGFPMPQRGAQGERAYALAQIEKLRVVKRLIDAGHRPGRLVPLPLDELLLLSGQGDGNRLAEADSTSRSEPATLLALLTANQGAQLRLHLRQLQARLGLGAFVTEVVSPTNRLVGEAWMRGQLEIYQEHNYTETLQGVLRAGILSLAEASATQRPRVLLSTLRGEPHGLGLLMAEAVLGAEGAHCIALGVQTPVWDLVLAAQAYQADVVALSFTDCINSRQVRAGLGELKTKLPSTVEVWAGGSAQALHRQPVQGVVAMKSITEIAAHLIRWRAAQP